MANADLKVSVLVKWFKHVDRLKVLVATFSDKGATAALDAQVERMNLMYKSLTGESGPDVNKGALYN